MVVISVLPILRHIRPLVLVLLLFLIGVGWEFWGVLFLKVFLLGFVFLLIWVFRIFCTRLFVSDLL